MKVWLAASVALAGLFVICIKENFSISIGDLYTLIGALGFAIYLIKVEQHSKNLNVITTIVPMFATCGLNYSKVQFSPRLSITNQFNCGW